MVERIIVVMGVMVVIGFLWLTWYLYKGLLVRRLRHVVDQNRGKPRLLYFTADYCTTCRLRQTPVVQELAGRLGHHVTVEAYDVTENPDLVKKYKVLTLPTTIVINRAGQVDAVNYGLTPLGKLEQQLANL
jgi:thioredoxin 1